MGLLQYIANESIENDFIVKSESQNKTRLKDGTIFYIKNIVHGEKYSLQTH
jgi:hypothetical protein